MSVELAKTFLEIVQTGNFVQASKTLHLTQSTVSARIQALENLLGTRLFVRNRGGVKLTAAGKRFLPHAANIVQTWSHAKQTISTPEGFDSQVSVGARFGIWDQLLFAWTSWMKEHSPEVAIRTDLRMADSLLSRIRDGQLDIAILYDPPSVPGLEARALMRDEFILVSSSSEFRVLGEGYVFVDWSDEFRRQHRLHFPSFSGSGISVNSGSYGLSLIRTLGGAGYFPRRMVKADMEAGQLVEVPDAPKFGFDAYLVHHHSDENKETQSAIEAFYACANSLNLINLDAKN